ncbi:hypothetical protein BZG24_30405, partial [Escherichia coli]|nr:hypothetical protein [Escherichia coli]
LRALLRVHSDDQCTVLLADEPTAHLDEANARAVRELLGELPARCAILLASHDPAFGQSQNPGRAVEAAEAVAYGQAMCHQQPDASQTQPGATAQAPGNTRFNPMRDLLMGYKAAPKAVLWGTASVLCAVALAALS